MAYTNNLYVVAAICGNFWQESTVNPGIWENLTVGAPGYGLGQWTDSVGVSRRTALFNWLDDHGYPHDSGEGQMRFLVYEDLWIPSLISPSAYQTMTDFFNSNSTSLHDCVLEWMYHWEGINDGTDSVRLTAAQRYYNLFTNDDGTRQPWTAGNRYLSQQEADYNALLIKDFLYGPVTPPQPSDEEIIALISAVMKLRKKGADIHIVL